METLNFIGFFDKNQIDMIPEGAGIYAAFACIIRNGKIVKGKLLYIGKGEGDEGILSRVEKHVSNNDGSPNRNQSYWEEKYPECIILYNYALKDRNLHDIEAALVYHNQPEMNDRLKDRYCGYSNNIGIECGGEIGSIHKRTVIQNRQVMR